MTDNNGYFAGKMPANEELTMTISQYGQCYQNLVTNIGPFDMDTDLGVIEVTSPDLVEITGTVLDCDMMPLTNGWVTLTLGNQLTYFYLEDDNVISTSMFNCDNATELEVVGVNLDDLEESDVLTYTVAPTIDLGAIDACGNVLDEYFTMTVNGGTPRTLIVVSAVDSTGSLLVFANEPGTNENISLSFVLDPNDTYPQTFDGSIVEWMYSYLDYQAPQGILSHECGSVDCGITEIVITEYGAVGEKIKGTFSGVTDFWDNMQQQTNLPYSGEFEVTRDF